VLPAQRSLHLLGKSRWPIALKPTCSPISQEQLASEVKGIHAGLVMVEAKCIDIDSQKALHPEERLGKGRWPIALKPKCSPIPQEQLASEIKGIHAGLVMVEAKCINIDSQTALHSEERLGTEHHDFLIATQHPFSNLAPLRLI
jgi:hypothetical protein